MEQIYTIPINEAFEKGMEDGTCDCPICKLFDKMEKKEVEMALGPAMMEPSNRMITNEKGFCHHHYKLLTEQSNSLSLALVLESHLATLKEKFDGNFVSNLFGGKYRNHQKTAQEKGENSLSDPSNIEVDNVFGDDLFIAKKKNNDDLN